MEINKSCLIINKGIQKKHWGHRYKYYACGQDGQQSVFHFLPRFKGDGLDLWPNLSKRDPNINEIWAKLKMIN